VRDTHPAATTNPVFALVREHLHGLQRLSAIINQPLLCNSVCLLLGATCGAKQSQNSLAPKVQARWRNRNIPRAISSFWRSTKRDTTDACGLSAMITSRAAMAGLRCSNSLFEARTHNVTRQGSACKPDGVVHAHVDGPNELIFLECELGQVALLERPGQVDTRGHLSECIPPCGLGWCSTQQAHSKQLEDAAHHASRTPSTRSVPCTTRHPRSDHERTPSGAS